MSISPYDNQVGFRVTDIDEVLLSRIGRGDAEAFERFYDAWSGRLFALILQILVDRAQSEEVLQEVFLEVWRHASSYDPQRGSAQAWVVTLARRRAIDRVRASQAHRDREAKIPHASADYDQTVEKVEERMVQEEVRHMLKELGEPYRSTIILAYFTGLSHAQIAQVTRTPLGTVKTRIRDGLSRMRQWMEVQR